MENGAGLIKEADYHKYIFRNGRLVGQFEKMYVESVQVPWDQDKTARSWWADIALSVLKIRSPYTSAIDVGCGLGYFTNRIARLCKDVVGVDVSSTAVRKAEETFPHLKFRAMDIRKSYRSLSSFQLVVAKDIFWYVFPKMDQVVRNLKALTLPGGHCFVFQSFPNLDHPFVGKEVIPTPERLLEHFLDEFSLEYSCRCQEYQRPQDGPMCIALLQKKGTGGA